MHSIIKSWELYEALITGTKNQTICGLISNPYKMNCDEMTDV